jgi:hypothetical protein|nr:MAG: hypothetical protein [Lake Baikal virophage 15]
MSVANFGPNYRVQSVANLLVADIVVPITADGAATVVTPLIQTAAGAEIPLVLGEGVWALTARVAINTGNAAGTYQLIQGTLYQGAALVAHCPMAFGGDILNGANQELYGSVAYFATVAPGATASFTWRLRSTGNSIALDVTAGYANIVATKLSV